MVFCKTNNIKTYKFEQWAEWRIQASYGYIIFNWTYCQIIIITSYSLLPSVLARYNIFAEYPLHTKPVLYGSKFPDLNCTKTLLVQTRIRANSSARDCHAQAHYKIKNFIPIQFLQICWVLQLKNSSKNILMHQFHF